MKTKTKGKAIIGIAMVAIIGAVILAAVPTVSAVSNGTNFNYIGNQSTSVQTVLIGQNLQFNVSAATSTQNFTSMPTVYRYGASGFVENTYVPDANNRSYNIAWSTTGSYYVSTNSTGDVGKKSQAQLSVATPNLPLKLKVGTKEVSSVTLGTNITIDTGGINLFDGDQVNLVIIGPDGQMKTNGSQTYATTHGITVTALTALGVSTSNIATGSWKVGDYTFQIKTVSVNASGLDASSDVKELSVLKGEIDISAETTSVTELETLKLTVTGVSGDSININATPTSTHVLFQGGIDDTPTSANNRANFSHTIDADGKRTYVVKFDATGSYTIKVIVTAGSAVGESDTVDITVAEKGVTFDVPTTVIIGERLTIKGTASSGERVTVTVEDKVYDIIERMVVDANGEFSKEIDTTDACGSLFSVPGSVRLKAYIDAAVVATEGDDVPTTWTSDGTAVVLMKRGGLTVELSTTNVAQEDDFTISGVAKGSKNIDILIVAPKGSGGSLIESGANTLTGNIYHESTSVSEIDDTYSKKVTVKANADTGSYLVVVLSKGSDDKYGLSAAELNTSTGGALAGYTLAAKTLDQILAILEDAMWGAAGSDDLYDVKYVKVAAAVVTLDPVASVGIGEPLVVTGTTNRKEGFAIVLTVKGPMELTPQTVTVENGVFNATFDTADATVGTYTVKADDGDGHTDDATAEILTAVPATPTPVVEVTATPEVTPTIPVAEATATPEPTPTPTPTPTPGFEAVFAIAGLLAVAYLVQRKRRE
ncbi:MAG: PGF-CTERM sorting domain-containing protein [Halobacteriota archaeon]